jgi:hypothetical protein
MPAIRRVASALLGQRAVLRSPSLSCLASPFCPSRAWGQVRRRCEAALRLCRRRTEAQGILRTILRTIDDPLRDGPLSTAKYHPGVILRSMPSPISRLQDIAEGQWGLVTLQQARGAGLAWPSLARQVDVGLVERVAHGIYRLRGAPEPDHLALRAAWLQLDPGRPAWQRLEDPEVAVVSHASAAAMYGVGDLRADVHEFTLPKRRQTRRPDVRIHRGRVPADRMVIVGGLPVTRAGWIVGELLEDRVDPDAVAQITSEILNRALDYPRVVADVLSPYSARFGLPPNDGLRLLDEFLLRAGNPDR